jgi:hypothetical protein
MRRTLAALGVAVLTTIGVTQAASAADYGFDGIDMDCSYNDFDSVEEARAYWFNDGGSINRNVDDMDRDRDGTACDAGLSDTPSGDGSDDSSDDSVDDSDDSADDSSDDSSDDSGDDSADRTDDGGDDSSDDSADDDGTDAGAGDPETDDGDDRVQDTSDDAGDGDDSSDDSGDGSGDDDSSTDESAGDPNDGVTVLPSTGAGAHSDSPYTSILIVMGSIAAAVVLGAKLVARRS